MCEAGQIRTDEYGYDTYTWDGTQRIVVRDTTERGSVTSYPPEAYPPNGYEADYRLPELELPLDTPLAQYVVDSYSQYGHDIVGMGQRIQVYYQGGGTLRLEVINVLKASVAEPADVVKVGTGPGKLTVHVVPADGRSAITKSVQGYVSLDPLAPAPAALTTFTADDPQALAFSGLFDIPVEGTYYYTVIIGDGQPNLTGRVGVGKATVVATQFALLITEPVATAPAKLGQATGQATVVITVTGGTGAELAVALTPPDSPTPVIHPTTTLDGRVHTAVFEGLTAGLYPLRAYVTNTTAAPAEDQATANVLPPDLELGDQLTFLPWVQPALTHAASRPPAVPPAVPAAPRLRPTLALGATLRTDQGTAEPVAATQAEIYGPGDVLGLNQRALLATTPVPGATGFSSLQLAAIEFKEEDLPWRYSTLQQPAATPADEPVPLPWLMLLVLRPDEFDALPLAGRPLPSIRVKAPGAYPSREPAQQKLWAHVQVNASLGALDPRDPTKRQQPTSLEISKFLAQDLPRNPDLAYSRVFCPRRLAPNTAYTACLVPAVEAGRLAGLGLDFAPADVRASALPPAAPTPADRLFPVYYQWSFSTGTEDDFEVLVQELHQANATTSTATAPSLALTTAPGTTYQLPLVGALVDGQAPALTPSAPTAQAVAQYLYGQVQPGRSASGRPLVGAPVYGRAYLARPTLAPPTSPLATTWAQALNLDPRYRALAAIGAEVVRDNQEEYVRRAWDQVQDILLANEKLRGAQYGLRTTAGLRNQHLPVNTTTITPAPTLTPTGRSFAAPPPAADTTNTDAAAKEAAADTPFFSTLAASAEAPAARPTQRTALADYGLHLTGPAMRRVRVSAATIAAAARANPGAPALPRVTLHEAIRRSNMPLAAFSPAFRRITKPFGNYQVGQAGRPLRPTQPEPAADPTDLRTRATSLRQRDAVLSQLSAGTLAAAPAHAETLRGYQFLDDRVDAFLRASVPSAAQPTPLTLVPHALPAAARARFDLAYRAFATQAVNPATQQVTVVGFRKPQYVRPALPLAPLKSDLVAATNPGPAFTEKIKVVAPALGALPPVSKGDFEGKDFIYTDFYVNDDLAPGRASDFQTADFQAADFQVVPPTEAPAPLARPASPAPASAARTASFAARTTESSPTASPAATVTTTAAAPATDAELPIIKQAKVFPVFKDAMGEALRLRHPELLVPGLHEFPLGGMALLDVNPAFIEAYMVGLNHALGSELHWRGFPVDLRGTFFQQFWDVSEHFNATLAPEALPDAAAEAALLDIKPLDQWGANPLGGNGVAAPTAGAATLRLALRSELLRRYPTLILALQDESLATGALPRDPTDPANFRHPRQRLAVGQDMVVVTFDVPLAHARASCALALMERPGQPTFGLDADDPAADHTRDPLSWNDFSWAYAKTPVEASFEPTTTGQPGTTPHAATEPASVAYLTTSAVVAYALLQEPILALIPLKNILSA